MVSYAEKHNEAQRREHRRRQDNNNARGNHGVEGPSDDPPSRAPPAADASMLATLRCAQGTPMILGATSVRAKPHGNNQKHTVRTTKRAGRLAV